MPVQEEERKKEDQVYEEPEENKRKQAPEQQEKKDEISNNTEERKSGKLLPFLNVKAELHQNKIANIDSKIASKEDKLAKNEAKIERLYEKAERLEDRNTMLRNTVGKIPAVKKLIESNEAKIDRIRNEKIPARMEKCTAHREKIEELNAQKQKITHKLNRVIALSDTIKSFSLSHNAERREMFVNAMNSLNKATADCINDKLSVLKTQKAELTEAYNTSLSMTEKIDIQNKLNGVDRRIMKLNEKLGSIEEPKKLPDKAVDETMKAAEEKVTEIENSETEISVSEIADELTETVHEKIHSLDIESMSAEENIDNSEISYGRKDSVLFVADIDPATCSDDELHAFRESIRDNAECAGAIAKALSDNYGTKSAWSLDSEGALNDVRKNFSSDRIAFVLASALSGSKDGRINAAVKDWAQNYMKSIPDMYKQKPAYLGGAHPGIVNIFADKFIKSQQSEKVQHKEKANFTTINREYYHSLNQEDRYINVVTKSEADKIKQKLDDKNIPFSSVETKDLATITVSKENEKAFDDIAKSVKDERAVKYVNPEFYKSLPKEERETTSMTQPEAEKKVAELQDKGVPVSAILNGDKSAVTVAKPGYFSRNQLKQEARKVSNDEKPKIKEQNKSKNHGLE